MPRASAHFGQLELAAKVNEGDALDGLGCGGGEFVHQGVVMDNLRWCIGHGLDVVVGTSGFGEDRLAQVRSWLADAPSVRVLIAANFSVGAVLMMSFAAQAARFFEWARDHRTAPRGRDGRPVRHRVPDGVADRRGPRGRRAGPDA